MQKKCLREPKLLRGLGSQHHCSYLPFIDLPSKISLSESTSPIQTSKLSFLIEKYQVVSTDW